MLQWLTYHEDGGIEKYDGPSADTVATYIVELVLGKAGERQTAIMHAVIEGARDGVIRIHKERDMLAKLVSDLTGKEVPEV